MAKINLSDEDLKILSECINNQTEIPEDLLLKLSPGFFEKLRQAGKFDYRELDKYKIPTIEYAGKRPESRILAQAHITGGAAPLQIVRSFANGKNGDWKNLIVQGDNLQFLKTCYLNQDPLIKNKVKGKVNLIYIDPPFATKSEFGSDEGERSYSDRVENAEFLEALRERLLYARELIDPNGSIVVHFDQKMSHYVKVMMDEIFGKEKFRNEIIWGYGGGGAPRDYYPQKHDNLFWYSIGSKWTFNKQYRPYSEKTLQRGLTAVKGPEYKLSEEGAGLDDWWVDDKVQKILSPTAYENLKYPTQKPEGLLC